jgi:hypothetical protein
MGVGYNLDFFSEVLPDSSHLEFMDFQWIGKSIHQANMMNAFYITYVSALLWAGGS